MVTIQLIRRLHKDDSQDSRDSIHQLRDTINRDREDIISRDSRDIISQLQDTISRDRVDTISKFRDTISRDGEDTISRLRDTISRTSLDTITRIMDTIIRIRMDTILDTISRDRDMAAGIQSHMIRTAAIMDVVRINAFYTIT